MKVSQHFVRALGTLTLATISACGSAPSNSPAPANGPAPTVNSPVVNPTPATTADQNSTPAPATSQAQPAAQPAQQVAPIVDTAVNSAVSSGANTTNAMDPSGVPYNANANIPFAPQYSQSAPSQFNPNAPTYFQEIQTYGQNLSSPYIQDGNGLQLPYLNQRYSDYRGFLNYGQSFGQVRPGCGSWNNNNYRVVQDNFGRARSWLNRDIFVLIDRTLDILSHRNFHSSERLEDQIRDAERRHDSDSASRLNDRLLDEFDHGQRHDDHRGQH